MVALLLCTLLGCVPDAPPAATEDVTPVRERTLAVLFQDPSGHPISRVSARDAVPGELLATSSDDGRLTLPVSHPRLSARGEDGWKDAWTAQFAAYGWNTEKLKIDPTSPPAALITITMTRAAQRGTITVRAPERSCATCTVVAQAELSAGVFVVRDGVARVPTFEGMTQVVLRWTCPRHRSRPAEFLVPLESDSGDSDVQVELTTCSNVTIQSSSNLGQVGVIAFVPLPDEKTPATLLRHAYAALLVGEAPVLESDGRVVRYTGLEAMRHRWIGRVLGGPIQVSEIDTSNPCVLQLHSGAAAPGTIKEIELSEPLGRCVVIPGRWGLSDTLVMLSSVRRYTPVTRMFGDPNAWEGVAAYAESWGGWHGVLPARARLELAPDERWVTVLSPVDGLSWLELPSATRHGALVEFEASLGGSLEPGGSLRVFERSGVSALESVTEQPSAEVLPREGSFRRFSLVPGRYVAEFRLRGARGVKRAEFSISTPDRVTVRLD